MDRTRPAQSRQTCTKASTEAHHQRIRQGRVLRNRLIGDAAVNGAHAVAVHIRVAGAVHAVHAGTLHRQAAVGLHRAVVDLALGDDVWDEVPVVVVLHGVGAGVTGYHNERI